MTQDDLAILQEIESREGPGVGAWLRRLLGLGGPQVTVGAPQSAEPFRENSWLNRQLGRVTPELPAVRVEGPPIQPGREPAWLRVQQMLQSPFYADTMASVVGGLPEVYNHPYVARSLWSGAPRPNVLAEMDRNPEAHQQIVTYPTYREDIPPGAFYDETMNHELGHVASFRPGVMPQELLSVIDSVYANPELRGKTGLNSYSHKSPNELLAESFMEMLHVLRRTGLGQGAGGQSLGSGGDLRAAYDSTMSWSPDITASPNKEMLDWLLSQPIYAGHPLNRPRE
jgi:hypothetical protein